MPNRKDRTAPAAPAIRIRGARQNNLKAIDLDVPAGSLIVLTGKSGSGKSSLAFDTLYAEGQRRYVETFSPYARQFLQRMDRPRVDQVEGILPAVAIGHANNVRTSRSTVGTMTELTDYLKLLFARMAQLHCRGCGRPVLRDDPASIRDRLANDHPGASPLIVFPVLFPASVSAGEVAGTLANQGFRRLLIGSDVRQIDPGAPPPRDPNAAWWVVADRIRLTPAGKPRALEALESALHWGKGELRSVIEGQAPLHFSSHLHCPYCDIDYSDPAPSLFSFNNPLGACSRCRGFGRIIEIDPDLVVPDQRLSLAEGAIRPWSTAVGSECLPDLRRFCKRRGIPMDRAFAALDTEQQRLVFDGDDTFYGINGFFRWLESKTYKMHVRVLLSRYRAYSPCPVCRGTRLREEALLYRVRDSTLPEIYAMAVSDAAAFFETLPTPRQRTHPQTLLLREIRSRLAYLVEAGLGYLTMDRPSRTLSGGELERVHLTAALGNALVNTLYVLDEPTVGLHPRDVDRMAGILERLRDLGNTVMVVEHDPEIIRRADHLIDLGPGAGEEGGRIVYSGPVAGILAERTSLTGNYLAGRLRIRPPRTRRSPDPAHRLRIVGASQHNLKQVDVEIPLDLFVCVTGVSGSGKSTLIHDVLYRNLVRGLGRPVSDVGACTAIEGMELIDDVVLVDQQPIGRTGRSNPATYVGIWDAIRRRFAALDDARRAGFRAGDFSFNSGAGRCDRCRGSGVERIEMQFLSDVYLKCPACDGRRFRDDILLVRDRGKSVADVLELTAREAADFYTENPDVVLGLRVLDEVGLGYVRLGQPVTTLSGGEAQRLKLAGHLAGAQAAGNGRALLLLDEPTTGLHLDDIRILVEALQRLVDAGRSVVVIEHNMDLVAQADHVIDLGPEGGDDGGRVLAVDAPEDIAACPASFTGAALRHVLSPRRRVAGGRLPRTRRRAAVDNRIRVTGAREHNLQQISVAIPRDCLTVVTGVSGSGKSSLAFDVLYGEGQRRYLDTLSAYVRQYVGQLAPADVDAVTGIPPTVAIEQRLSRGGRKSTVATVTEIANFLRLLMARLGVPHCPGCDVPIREQTVDEVVRAVRRDFAGRRVRILARLVSARKGFHREAAAWAAAHGYERIRTDGRYVAANAFPKLDRYHDHDVDVVIGAVIPAKTGRDDTTRRLCIAALDAGRSALRVAPLPRGADRLYSSARSCPECGQAFPEPDPRLFSFHSHVGWCPACRGLGIETQADLDDEDLERLEFADLGSETPCSACEGRRLRPEALAVRFQARSIDTWSALSVDQLDDAFAKLRLRGREAEIGRDILAEIASRARFLKDVGLGYLTLDRRADTLSGGESQRIRLAAQLGSNLRGVCYILDEPTIGLHPRDNERLIGTLRRLRAAGNTVVVVEHDAAVIRSAEHVVDLGPGPGAQGGRVVAQGTPAEIARNRRSQTGRWLAMGGGARPREPRSLQDAGWISVRAARVHNLRELDVDIPVGRFTGICGVSGSGKSSLLHDVFVPAARAVLRRRKVAAAWCDEIRGVQAIRRVCEVDQSPIGKTPRSVPATYIKVWDNIRAVFANTPEARLRGYGPGRFSFNSPQGRCPACDGQGRVRVEMSFLPDTFVPCTACDGRRYAAQTLEVEYRGKTIADILRLTVQEAGVFFSAHPRISRGLGLMTEVGLGYLELGQTSPTLSGGEAQRLKLVAELARSAAGSTLYVLEEPTIGLHMADVQRLTLALHRLVNAGNTVVVIEHNLDLLAETDYLVELGPGGGEQGGRLLYQGTPGRLARRGTKRSPTAPFLRPYFNRDTTAGR